MTVTTANDLTKSDAINLVEFRAIVDASPAGITSCGNDLNQLYAYVGLKDTGSQTRNAVSEALYKRVKTSFATGHQVAQQTCRSLITDLIREHVIRGVPLDPYFEILAHLRDALRSDDKSYNIQGDWAAAISAACDHVEIHSWGIENRERTYAREYEVARAAKALEDAGFEINLSPGSINLTEAGETKLIQRIETLIRKIGGLNVARRIFTAIDSQYDANQARYHLVPPISSIGGGSPQVPWGYLLQLAVKHIEGDKPLNNSDSDWKTLRSLAIAYAAVIDVQSYTHIAWQTFDADELLHFLRNLALNDTLFRIPQLRPSDVERLTRGMLDFIDNTIQTKNGWTIDQALSVISHILDPARDVRGPIIFSKRDISKALPDIPQPLVHTILDEVLCHPISGSNQHFSRPTDAPRREDRTLGVNFGERPLLKLGKRYCLIDRSACAQACIEALLAALRTEHSRLDDSVGKAVERFIESELEKHNIPTMCGDYDHNKDHGECDLVVETPDKLIFFELKKKALTRRARAGMDIDLLPDLAGSQLQAHAQLGWHEVRILESKKLDLVYDGTVSTLNLGDREIEKFAISLFDYGSYQDRIVLKHFLEATMNAEFHPHDKQFNKKFDKINASLEELREQIRLKNPDQKIVDQPFFNCWFISVPLFLIMLDGVRDPASFRDSVLACRHITTGTADLYYEISYIRQLREANASRTS